MNDENNINYLKEKIIIEELEELIIKEALETIKIYEYMEILKGKIEEENEEEIIETHGIR